MKAYGDIIAEARTVETGEIWYRLAAPAMPRLRTATGTYVHDHNKTFGTKYSVSYPKPFRMVLKERRARR